MGRMIARMSAEIPAWRPFSMKSRGGIGGIVGIAHDRMGHDPGALGGQGVEEAPGRLGGGPGEASRASEGGEEGAQAPVER